MARSIFLATLTLAAWTPMVQAQEANPEAETAARVALDAFAACVAERDPGESLRVLNRDFRTNAYRNGLRLLASDSRGDCAYDAVGQRNALRSSNLLMAGSIAENWLEQGDAPVNVRIARAVETPAETFAPTDAVAQCLVRSMPDQVGALFATVPGDSAEGTSASPLLAAIEPCSQAAEITSRIEMSVPALRAMIATAALRLVAQSENPDA
ncbi:MAG: hypothetical protein JY451_13505 [Erythrobacter sp.]|nr:MAG: hypothetical protein JY451_13505 [Erythrobacter sp.]